ncbi:hypothetical protein LJK88_49595 [Paenibacillus sp. P26]|nr:hypothetical protein LJK88_49595 [Paenibacillus sp. P26]UUZ91502.1 hypothetical protein LJK87_38750 [Paenibacillus sp. P25]
MSENAKHQGNYEGTADMEAENQDMEFVNDTLNATKSTVNLVGAIKKHKKEEP